MGFVPSKEATDTVAMFLRTAKRSGFKDTKQAIRDSRLKAMHEIGKDGVRFLDSIMPKESLVGWGYSIKEEKNVMNVVFEHKHGKNNSTQHKKEKWDKKRKRYVTVSDVINMLDVGTPPHPSPPSDEPSMFFRGKYGEYEGKMYGLKFVSGIKAHNFFIRLKAYLNNRGTYWWDFNSTMNGEFEAILTGKRRKGFTR